MSNEASVLRHYIVPAAALAVAILVRWLLDPWLGNAWATPLVSGAVAAAVWYGGWKQATVIALVGFLAADWLFMRGSLATSGTTGVLGLLLYSISCALI